MIHCYAMLPYFRESKEDFDEIAQLMIETFTSCMEEKTK
jgi:hypothetical protein